MLLFFTPPLGDGACEIALSSHGNLFAQTPLRLGSLGYFSTL